MSGALHPLRLMPSWLSQKQLYLHVNCLSYLSAVRGGAVGSGTATQAAMSRV